MKESQSSQILAHLQAGRTLTAREALDRFGCFRLAARVNDLVHQGHPIQARTVEMGTKRVAEYYIEREPDALFDVKPRGFFR